MQRTRLASVAAAAGAMASGGSHSIALGQPVDCGGPVSALRFDAPGPIASRPPTPWYNPMDALLYDNGPFVTGPLAAGGCQGDQSLVQSAALCLSIRGYNVAGEAPDMYKLADDFVLATPSVVTAITVFAYEIEGAVPLPPILGGKVRIHGGPPVAPLVPPPIAATFMHDPAVFTMTYRQYEPPLLADCSRNIQRIRFTFAPPVNLPAGVYWITVGLAGTPPAANGPYIPQVSLLGLPGKPGANAMQFSIATGVFAPIVDAGLAACAPAPPLPNPQDIPFLVEGTACYPDCDGSGLLTVADFGCFQTKFVSGDPYADCNGAGGLTVADFGCFQTAFVAGCP